MPTTPRFRRSTCPPACLPGCARWRRGRRARERTRRPSGRRSSSACRTICVRGTRVPPLTGRALLDRARLPARRIVGDPPLELQLGVEVGLLAMAVAEVLARQQLDEDLDEVAVELAAGDALELLDRLH